MKDVFILEGARTPFGTFGGSLKDVSPTDLGIVASKEALRKSGVEASEIDLSVIGNVIHSTSNASYLARHIALGAGVPIESPALTVNRLCGSGMQSVISAAQSIMMDEGKTALAGGADNMSLSPYALRGSRFGAKTGAPKIDDMLMATLTDEYTGFGMGITGENLAKQYSISREDQDQFAFESQQRAARAREQGLFAEEIASVEVTSSKGVNHISVDEHIREGTTVDKLASLKPAFRKNGTVTGGNASGINDGAAAVVLAGEDYLSSNNRAPIARIVSWGIAGVDPSIMGIGPVPAIKKALHKANLTIQEMDLVEVNEAFAAQYLAVEKALELDRSIVNVNGGAIALGHPVGASGTRVLYTLIKELKRRNGKYGVASLCIGGGQGIAMVVEVM
ncbi:acetyl-CoA C-acetyltransferase [Alkalihalobacillus macyae]|uniref:thiolase family protein n=1 Tax=Guptibacillus hwajinpoensis TaxID=208199 RepID=UPI00273BAF9D|nr:acetyl-CoA C-acetyltransferase [Alkalihalobacillus macyae]MDP4551871.1 acetyl-CoA C-acetyltransferase [Alkalihalobacillus macyae]